MARQSFLRHAVIYSLAPILVNAGQIILLPILTRTLSPGELGELAVPVQFGQIVGITLLFGAFRQATLVFHGQRKDLPHRQEIVSSLLVLLACVNVIGIGTVLGTANWICQGLDIANVDLLRLAVVAMVMESTMVTLLAVSQGREESTFYVTVTVCQFLARGLLTIVLVVGFGWSIWGVVTAGALTSGLCALGLAIRELARGARWPSREMLRSMLWFGLPLLPGSLGFFLLNSGDRFFLKHYATDSVIGNYDLGYKLAMVVSLFGKMPFTMVWGARMFDAAKEPDAPGIFGRIFTRLLGAYTFVGLGLCVLQDEAVAMLGDVRYAAAAQIIAPVVLAYLFLTAADLMDSSFYVMRRTFHKTWISLCSTVVMLTLYALLIPQGAALGAALATLGGFLFHAILTFFVSQRVFWVRYEFVRVALMLASALGLWLISRTLPTGLWTIPGKLLLCFSWPILLGVCGLLSAEEKEYAWAVLANVSQKIRGLLPVRLPGRVR